MSDDHSWHGFDSSQVTALIRVEVFQSGQMEDTSSDFSSAVWRVAMDGRLKVEGDALFGSPVGSVIAILFGWCGLGLDGV